MVTTRSQARRQGTTPTPYNDAIDRMRRSRRYRARYKPGDECKRHRLPDGQRKGELVQSYYRRA